MDWPLTEKQNLRQIRGLFRILLPEDSQHPEAVKILTDINGEYNWVHRTGHIKHDCAMAAIKELNEWKRQRGGRPVYVNMKEHANGDEV